MRKCCSENIGGYVCSSMQLVDSVGLFPSMKIWGGAYMNEAAMWSAKVQMYLCVS